MNSRLDRLRNTMGSQNVPAFFVSGMENIRYLTGFTGSAGFSFVSPDQALFFADSRYHIQAREECRDFEVVACTSQLIPDAAETLKTLGVPTLGVEKNHLTLGQSIQLQELLPDTTLQPTDDLIECLRRVKEPEEIDAIRRCCVLADRTFEHILPYFKEGVAERDVALEMDFFMRRQGATRSAFETIVAFGEHSAYPHARPDGRTLKRGQFITMDFGAFMGGYNSDLTRTVVFGPATDRHREIYEIVYEAQRRALAALKPGIEGKDADAAARDYITERGYGDRFGHGLGHGLGRETHDGGALNKTSETKLEPGQVWTVEPGVYVEGFGGVRIEDDVVMTAEGCEILTSAPKDFIVIE